MPTDLPPEQVRYANDNGVLVNREAQRRGAYMLNRYFPDCTPTCRKLRGGFISRNKLHHRDAAGHQLYCRVLYPKHIALMDASATHRETGMIAGNRVGKCCSERTYVDTTDGRKSIHDLFQRGSGFEVWAWDGHRRVRAKASPVFRKPSVEPCYRLTMSDGRWVEVADEHRLLTDAGFQPLSRLLRGCDDGPLATISVDDLSTRGEGDLRCTGKAGGCSGRCAPGSCRCGGRLPLCPGNGRGSPPSRGGAREYNQPWWREGALASRYTSSPLLGGVRLASPDGQLLLSGLFAGCGAGSAYTSARWSSRVFRVAERLLAALVPPLLSSSSACFREPRILLSSLASHMVSCDYIGMREVYDFEVQTHHNYLAGGLVHHNSDIGAYSTTCHMTGLYPHWWRGRRFKEPVAVWAAGDTGKTTRNIIQEKLLGVASSIGTGFIPAHLIVAKTKKSGIANAYEMVWVRHVPTGKVSTIELKSYDQRRESFQGTAQHVIWLDEEPPMDIYAECLLRTTKTSDFPGGMILLTFTPLQGRTVLVKQFLSDAVRLDTTEGE